METKTRNETYPETALEERGNIVRLPVEKIFPHPNNPRTALGNLKELAASIKVNGIMQNLTVVERPEGGYTVIIGHRRLAAAKKAGLSEVPCAIAKLDEREQIGIMLTENMQRADLTLVEQAQTMQLMLDLGETVKTIADKTGFTKQTIRKRVRLMELDPALLKKLSGRQVTLADLDKLDKLEDEEIRKKVAKDLGTANFQNSLSRAESEQKKVKNAAEIIKRLSAWATESKERPSYPGTAWQYQRYYNLSAEVKVMDFTAPDDADRVEYVYWVGGYTVELYRKRTEGEVAEKALKKRLDDEADARYKQGHGRRQARLRLPFGLCQRG